VGKVYLGTLSDWGKSGLDGRNRLELCFIGSALPKNSDWM